MDRLAIKRLTASDLTFFKWHFENENAGNQKAINLSRNVFIDKLYPSLPDRLSENDDIKIPVTLYLFGPGVNNDVYVLQRKILKSASYKNWRLNGEFIYPPENNPDRFNILKPNDIAIMGFEGLTIPKSIYIDFISANIAADEFIYQHLDEIIDSQRGGMKEISSQKLKEIVSKGNIEEEHPIYKYIVDVDLIEAVQGDSDAQIRVYRRSGGTMSQERLRTARQKAEDIGKLGEDLLAHYWDKKLLGQEITQFEWTSRDNAIAPYDFKISYPGEVILVDVKTTSGPFSTPIHISMAEIETMATSEHEYSIYRIYEINESGGLIRVANNMRSYAEKIKEAIINLPQGTRIDSISCNPEYLIFESPIKIYFEDEVE